MAKKPYQPPKVRKVEAQLELQWYEQLLLCFEVLAADERADLREWEAKSLPTSDWPGWEKYIGKPPHSERTRAMEKRA